MLLTVRRYNCKCSRVHFISGMTESVNASQLIVAYKITDYVPPLAVFEKRPIMERLFLVMIGKEGIKIFCLHSGHRRRDDKLLELCCEELEVLLLTYVLKISKNFLSPHCGLNTSPFPEIRNALTTLWTESLAKCGARPTKINPSHPDSQKVYIALAISPEPLMLQDTLLAVTVAVRNSGSASTHFRLEGIGKSLEVVIVVAHNNRLAFFQSLLTRSDITRKISLT